MERAAAGVSIEEEDEDDEDDIVGARWLSSGQKTVSCRDSAELSPFTNLPINLWSESVKVDRKRALFKTKVWVDQIWHKKVCGQSLIRDLKRLPLSKTNVN